MCEQSIIIHTDSTTVLILSLLYLRASSGMLPTCYVLQYRKRIKTKAIIHNAEFMRTTLPYVKVAGNMRGE